MNVNDWTNLIFVENVNYKIAITLVYILFFSKVRDVEYEVTKDGLFNVTTSKTEICCPGFYFNKNHKKKCKSKLSIFTYL